MFSQLLRVDASGSEVFSESSEGGLGDRDREGEDSVRSLPISTAGAGGIGVGEDQEAVTVHVNTAKLELYLQGIKKQLQRHEEEIKHPVWLSAFLHDSERFSQLQTKLDHCLRDVSSLRATLFNSLPTLAPPSTSFATAAAGESNGINRASVSGGKGLLSSGRDKDREGGKERGKGMGARAASTTNLDTGAVAVGKIAVLQSEVEGLKVLLRKIELKQSAEQHLFAQMQDIQRTQRLIMRELGTHARAGGGGVKRDGFRGVLAGLGLRGTGLGAGEDGDGYSDTDRSGSADAQEREQVQKLFADMRDDILKQVDDKLGKLRMDMQQELDEQWDFGQPIHEITPAAPISPSHISAAVAVDPVDNSPHDGDRNPVCGSEVREGLMSKSDGLESDGEERGEVGVTGKSGFKGTRPRSGSGMSGVSLVSLSSGGSNNTTPHAAGRRGGVSVPTKPPLSLHPFDREREKERERAVRRTVRGSVEDSKNEVEKEGEETNDWLVGAAVASNMERSVSSSEMEIERERDRRKPPDGALRTITNSPLSILHPSHTLSHTPSHNQQQTAVDYTQVLDTYQNRRWSRASAASGAGGGVGVGGATTTGGIQSRAPSFPNLLVHPNTASTSAGAETQTQTPMSKKQYRRNQLLRRSLQEMQIQGSGGFVSTDAHAATQRETYLLRERFTGLLNNIHRFGGSKLGKYVRRYYLRSAFLQWRCSDDRSPHKQTARSGGKKFFRILINRWASHKLLAYFKRWHQTALRLRLGADKRVVGRLKDVLSYWQGRVKPDLGRALNKWKQFVAETYAFETDCYQAFVRLADGRLNMGHLKHLAQKELVHKILRTARLGRWQWMRRKSGYSAQIHECGTSSEERGARELSLESFSAGQGKEERKERGLIINEDRKGRSLEDLLQLVMNESLSDYDTDGEDSEREETERAGEAGRDRGEEREKRQKGWKGGGAVRNKKRRDAELSAEEEAARGQLLERIEKQLAESGEHFRAQIEEVKEEVRDVGRKASANLSFYKTKMAVTSAFARDAAAEVQKRQQEAVDFLQQKLNMFETGRFLLDKKIKLAEEGLRALGTEVRANQLTLTELRETDRKQQIALSGVEGRVSEVEKAETKGEKAISKLTAHLKECTEYYDSELTLLRKISEELGFALQEIGQEFTENHIEAQRRIQRLESDDTFISSQRVSVKEILHLAQRYEDLRVKVWKGKVRVPLQYGSRTVNSTEINNNKNANNSSKSTKPPLYGSQSNGFGNSVPHFNASIAAPAHGAAQILTQPENAPNKTAHHNSTHADDSAYAHDSPLLRGHPFTQLTHDISTLARRVAASVCIATDTEVLHYISARTLSHLNSQPDSSLRSFSHINPPKAERLGKSRNQESTAVGATLDKSSLFAEEQRSAGMGDNRPLSASAVAGSRVGAAAPGTNRPHSASLPTNRHLTSAGGGAHAEQLSFAVLPHKVWHMVETRRQARVQELLTQLSLSQNQIVAGGVGGVQRVAARDEFSRLFRACIEAAMSKYPAMHRNETVASFSATTVPHPSDTQRMHFFAHSAGKIALFGREGMATGARSLSPPRTRTVTGRPQSAGTAILSFPPLSRSLTSSRLTAQTVLDGYFHISQIDQDLEEDKQGGEKRGEEGELSEVELSGEINSSGDLGSLSAGKFAEKRVLVKIAKPYSCTPMHRDAGERKESQDSIEKSEGRSEKRSSPLTQHTTASGRPASAGGVRGSAVEPRGKSGADAVGSGIGARGNGNSSRSRPHSAGAVPSPSRQFSRKVTENQSPPPKSGAERAALGRQGSLQEASQESGGSDSSIPFQAYAQSRGKDSKSTPLLPPNNGVTINAGGPDEEGMEEREPQLGHTPLWDPTEGSPQREDSGSSLATLRFLESHAGDHDHPSPIFSTPLHCSRALVGTAGDRSDVGNQQEHAEARTEDIQQGTGMIGERVETDGRHNTYKQHLDAALKYSQSQSRTPSGQLISQSHTISRPSASAVRGGDGGSVVAYVGKYESKPREKVRRYSSAGDRFDALRRQLHSQQHQHQSLSDAQLLKQERQQKQPRPVSASAISKLTRIRESTHASKRSGITAEVTPPSVGKVGIGQDEDGTNARFSYSQLTFFQLPHHAIVHGVNRSTNYPLRGGASGTPSDAFEPGSGFNSNAVTPIISDPPSKSMGAGFKAPSLPYNQHDQVQQGAESAGEAGSGETGFGSAIAEALADRFLRDTYTGLSVDTWAKRSLESAGNRFQSTSPGEIHREDSGIGVRFGTEMFSDSLDESDHDRNVFGTTPVGVAEDESNIVIGKEGNEGAEGDRLHTATIRKTDSKHSREGGEVEGSERELAPFMRARRLLPSKNSH